MPFGPKQTVGTSGHYSEAQSGSMWKLSGDVEAGGSQWKRVGDQQKVWKTSHGSEWKTRKGSEGVRKARKRSERPWKRAEEAGRLGKVTVCYSHSVPVGGMSGRPYQLRGSGPSEWQA